MTIRARHHLPALLLCLIGLLGCAAEDRARPPTADPTTDPTADPTADPTPPATGSPDLAAGLATLEAREQVRIGVHALDTATGEVLAYRAQERFAFASTIKALAAGAVLAELGPGGLDQTLRWRTDDLVDYSPVTELHVRDGLPVRRLIDASVTVSDNTAANVLVELLGGVGAFAADLEAIGDRTTSIDRLEPDLNTAVPGDVRDTTTPEQLTESLRAYLLGDVLPSADRQFLLSTMRRTSTGDDLIRAGVPADWRVADKTGSASYGVRNDVAVLHPPGRAPIVLTVMTTHDVADAEPDDALVAAATRLVVAALDD